MKTKFKDILERIKKNFQSNKIMLLVLSVVWIALVIAVLLINKDVFGKESYGNEMYENVVELTKNDSIKQSVEIIENSDVVAVKLATYARNNKGNITITVTGENSKEVYASKTVDVNFVQDNAFVTVALKEPLLSTKDKTIEVSLSSDCEKGSGLGVYYSNEKIFENSTLRINSSTKEGDLTLRFLYPEETLQLFNTIIMTWILVTFTLVVFLVLYVKPKYEVLFTIIAIIFGITFCTIITPMSVPDETAHYEYAFQLSNKIMNTKPDIFFNEEYQNYGSFGGHRNVSAAYKRLVTRINRPLNLKNSIVMMGNDIDETYKTCFVPQALGITLARLLNMNMLKTFYLGRLFNLMFYVLCVYLCIKITPIHKLIFGMLATLPIFMQQAASFSYDCFVNGLSFVLIAIIIKWLAGKETISNKDFVLALVVVVLLAPIKVIYGFYSFLLWLVPSERFGSRKRKIIMVLILTAPSIYEMVVLFYPYVSKLIRKMLEKIGLAKVVFAEDINALVSGNTGPLLEPTEDRINFSYMIDHPVEIFYLFYRTIRYSIKTWFYGSVGRILSGYTLILPTTLVHSILVLLGIASLREEDYVESAGFKISSLIVSILAGLMILFGMLITWTDANQEVIEAYGGPIIQGIQGRYFSPFLPYLFIMLNNTKIRIPKKYDDCILVSHVALVFITVIYVLTFTYIN